MNRIWIVCIGVFVAASVWSTLLTSIRIVRLDMDHETQKDSHHQVTLEVLVEENISNLNENANVNANEKEIIHRDMVVEYTTATSDAAPSSSVLQTTDATESPTGMPTLAPTSTNNDKHLEHKPLNVLLLYGDDWRYDTLGAAGHPVVKTPRLDQLAQEGILFSHNCVTTSVCWCSRANLYTGMYTTRHGTNRPRDWLTPWNMTVYDILQQAGYYVGHAGKWGIWIQDFGGIHFNVEEDGWHVAPRGDGLIQITEKNEEDALRFLRTRDKDKPFFLNVAFYATHAVDSNKTNPYTPQASSSAWYVNDTVPISRSSSEEAYNKLNHTIFSEWNEGRIRWHWRYSTSDDYQRNMKDMYRMVTEVDRTSGVLFDELKKQGVYDDTLIIFTTDNGNMHSEHLLAEKWYPQQESIRVPLIIKDPRMPKTKVGTTSDVFTLNIDLPTTILGAAGISPPNTMMGRDMSDLYLKDQQEVQWRNEFFYEHPMHVSKFNIPSSEALVRKDFKYFYWPDFELEQLFDLTEDPYEMNDVATSNETKYVAKLVEMKKRFSELKEIVHDRRPVTL